MIQKLMTVLVLLMAISSCGQNGALYLPDEKLEQLKPQSSETVESTPQNASNQTDDN